MCFPFSKRRDSILRFISNVSEIAKVIGGGGHRNAAGYTKFGFHNSII